MTEESDYYQAANGPDLKHLTKEYNGAGPQDGDWDRVGVNEQVRFAIWKNQNTDQTKEGSDAEPAFPFPGASDVRNYRADEVITDKVSTWMAAFQRVLMNIRNSISPTEPGDIDLSGALRKFLDWLVRNRLYSELLTESILYQNFKNTYGHCAIYVDWVRQIQNKQQEISMEDVMAIAQGKPEFRELVEAVQDPDREAEAIYFFQAIFKQFVLVKVKDIMQEEVPPLPDKRIRKAIRELRKTGKTSIPVPYVCKNEPCVVALQPYYDVLLPEGCTDVQTADVWFRREYITPREVDERTRTHKYDPAWAKLAKAEAGKTNWRTEQSGKTDNKLAQHLRRRQPRQQEDKVEVVTAFQWRVDEDNVPGIYVTVFHPAIDTSHASD